MSRIVIVSNRVADPSNAAQAGGVAVALADVVQRNHGAWIGWDGQVTDKASGKSTSVEPAIRRRKGAAIVTTPLDQEEHDCFYLGYANSVLWPVFHNRLDLAQFDGDYFPVYQKVNARFAKLVAAQLEPGDIIWIHDYHFILLGIELRKLGVTNPIGFFLHIPFPPAQLFQAIPEHLELARALAGYDLVGLQTRGDVAHLIDYFQHGAHGNILPTGQIRAFDRVFRVESIPIGIDPQQFYGARPALVKVQGRPGTRRMIGIDRLDYSKGLPNKFRAFGRFLEIAPQYQRQVVLTQIAPPTREDVDAYADIRRELELLSGSINGRFGELDWVPIHYIHRSIARTKLGEIYRGSKVGLVTPLRDGMNLVAKEYVAAQSPEDPGVLVLSQFAGAAEELTDALLVNPYNVDEMAKAMLAAIDMPQDERCARHSSLLAVVRENDVKSWCDKFIGSLRRNAGNFERPLSCTLADRYDTALLALQKQSR